MCHCWGNHDHIRTIKYTIQKHQDGIAWGALSKTFQEAIAITRRLGYRYLWIDSLCIIQDDEEDCLRESAAMFDIYQGSALTIAATRASDGSGGCFARSPQEYRGYSVRGSWENEDEPRVFFRKIINHKAYDDLGKAAMWGASPWSSHPLLSRAWALQERLLAPRVLYYGPIELLWSCHSLTDCECHADIERRGALKLHSQLSDGRQTHLETISTWHTTVKAYTKLDLTFNSDKLAAIGGLARRQLPLRNGRYLAGVWEDSLLEDLCWTSLNEPQPDRTRGPTWSWVSVNGWVWFTELSQPRCVVNEVVLHTPLKDIFTRFTGGYITVSGPVVSVTVHYDLPTNTDRFDHPRFDPVIVYKDVRASFYWDRSIDSEFARVLPSGSEVRCLLLGHKSSLFKRRRGYPFGLFSDM